MKQASRILLASSAGFVLLALVGIAVDVRQASGGTPLVATMATVVAPRTAERPIQAAIVLQKSDCSGNLRMLHLLHRKNVRERMQLRVIWYAGPVRDSTEIRGLLPAWTSTIPLQPLSHALFNELVRLGHNETPTLIVLDQDGRIRFTSRSPRSSREVAGLARIIEGLTWIEEL